MAGDELDRISSAIERLLRLNASRKVHANRAEAAGVELAPPGWVLLRRLDEDGPLSLSELAARADMDPAVTGRQVRQLEQGGLVERRPSDRDGRVTVVAATATGRDAFRAVQAVGRQHLADALADWSPDERARFADLLARFVDDLRPVGYRPVGSGNAEEP